MSVSPPGPWFPKTGGHPKAHAPLRAPSWRSWDRDLQEPCQRSRNGRQTHPWKPKAAEVLQNHGFTHFSAIRSETPGPAAFLTERRPGPAFRKLGIWGKIIQPRIYRNGLAGLQIADCRLWIVDCGLWIVDCRLQIADCGSQVGGLARCGPAPSGLPFGGLEIGCLAATRRGARWIADCRLRIVDCFDVSTLPKRNAGPPMKTVPP